MNDTDTWLAGFVDGALGVMGSSRKLMGSRADGVHYRRLRPLAR
jgi:hypothetical protein